MTFLGFELVLNCRYDIIRLVVKLFRRELMTEAQLNGPAVSALAMLGQASRLRSVRLALLGSK